VIVTGDYDAGRRQQTSADAGRVPLFKTMIIASAEGARPSPDAYLIEQAPDTVIRSHFHIGSEFQVFVAGNGSLGRTPVKPFIAQYVAAQTGYGPIAAGEEGLAYLTLRPLTLSGGKAQYLPDNRDKLDLAAPKRQIASKPFDAAGWNAGSGVATLIAPSADGLAAWIMRVEPDAATDAPVLDGGSGRFHVVMRGEMHVDGCVLDRLGIAWTTGDEPRLRLQAGSSGADVLVMQLPGNAWQ
jgi:hypothetical protein